MMAVYQESASSLSTIPEWSSEFKQVRESIENDPRASGTVCANSEEIKNMLNSLIKLYLKMPM